MYLSYTECSTFDSLVPYTENEVCNSSIQASFFYGMPLWNPCIPCIDVIFQFVNLDLHAFITY